MTPMTFRKNIFIWSIILLVIVTRLPFLFSGYGADADAWLAANSARMFWETGEYLESRLPGYPLHELISAPLVGIGGAPFSNAGTLFVSVCAIVVWFRFVRRTGRNPALLVTAFAFAPVFWQNSAVTLDYTWSLLFVLLALQAAHSGQAHYAGVMIAVAAGFRPSNLVVVVPLVILLIAGERHPGKAIRFLLVAGVSSALFLSPVLLKYGPAGWITSTMTEMSDMQPDIGLRIVSFFYRIIWFFGPVAFLLLVAMAVKNRNHLTAAIRSHDAVVRASLAGVTVLTALFFALPLERAYLLPMFPFVLLLADRVMSKGVLTLFTIALIVSGFVSIDVIDAQERRKGHLNVHAGMVLQEYMLRDALKKEKKNISAAEYPSRSVIMTRSGPFFWLENEHIEPVKGELSGSELSYASGHYRVMRQKKDTTVIFVAYLKSEEVDRVRSEGYAVYCLTQAQSNIESVAGYTLAGKKIPIIEPP